MQLMQDKDVIDDKQPEKLGDFSYGKQTGSAFLQAFLSASSLPAPVAATASLLQCNEQHFIRFCLSAVWLQALPVLYALVEIAHPFELR